MENLVGKKCLITGATGFIGSHLVMRLMKLGADVALFVLDEERHIPDDVLPIFRGNLQDAPDIARAVSRFQPEYIFHLAAQPLVDTALFNVYDTLDSNIRGSINLLQACVGSPKLKGIVFVSTDKVYGRFDGTVDESHPLLGVDHPYNASKVCADVMAQMYAKVFGLPIIIARSGNIYGDGDIHFDRIVPGTILSCLKKEPIIVRSNGKLTRDYIFVEDIVDAYLVLADAITKDGSLRGQAINLGAEQKMSVMDVVHTITGATGELSLEIVIQDKAKFEIPHQHLNYDYAKELGWKPKTSFEDGISQSVIWYKDYHDRGKRKND